MKNQFHRLSKPELLKKIRKIDGKIADAQGESLKKLHKTRRLLRRYFCECYYCAEGTNKFFTRHNGEEEERFDHDCGQEICPYFDHFVERVESGEDDIDKLLDQLARF